MFCWNEDMVRFLRDASEYSDYHARLAAWMAPYLSPSDRVCDAGCGLGYLSLALSHYVNSITAVDSSETALHILREKAADSGIIDIRCGDIHLLPPDVPYDAMVFSFFGKMDEIAAIAAAQCRGTVFAFKKNYVNHRFSVGEHPVGDDSFPRAIEWLEQRQIPYISETLELEMGQPLRSLDDAGRFFRLYNHGDDAELTEEFLQARLIETGRADFPLYLPQMRQVGCLRFAAADLVYNGHTV